VTVTLARRADIDLAAFARVAWNGENVTVAPRLAEWPAAGEFLAWWRPTPPQDLRRQRPLTTARTA
jgi:hypothetical protein